MELLISDSVKVYQQSKIKNKILLIGALVVDCSFLSVKETQELNNLNNTIFIEEIAGDLMLKELNETISKLNGNIIKGNKFVDSNNNSERLYGILYPAFSNFVFKKYIFLTWFKHLLNFLGKRNYSISLNFTSDLRLVNAEELQTSNSSITSIQTEFRKSTELVLKKIKNRLKNYFYFLQHALRSKKAEGDRVSENIDILFVVLNIPHHMNVLKSFFDLVLRDERITLHLVYYEFDSKISIRNIESYTPKSSRIKSYQFTQFRNSCFVFHHSLIRNLIQINKAYSIFSKADLFFNKEIHYSWMSEMFQVLNPDVCVHMSTHELGREMADVARYYNIPSVQVDYALFYDTFYMESHIKYDVRACISESVIDIWKKRNDPSKEFVPIGFCKLDNMVIEKDVLLKKAAFFNKNALNSGNKTVLFASTWALEGELYNEEKKIIIEALSEVCVNNSWNFIVKKHPLELDDFALEIIKKKANPNQIVFSHNELDINEAICFSDMVTTQMSSVILECFYYNKPFCLLTTNEKRNVYSGILENNSIPKFHDFQKFKNYAKDIFYDDEKKIEFVNKLKIEKEYVLYKSDNNASQRLLDIMLKLAAQRKLIKSGN